MARIRLAVGLVAAFLAVALAWALWPSETRHATPASSTSSLRTVIVADGAQPLPRTPFFALRDCLGRPRTCVNGAGGLVVAYGIVNGKPLGRSTATVLTDENCEPDRFGISHCLNALRLADGRRMTVRHDHDMGNDPCLAPGESVRVVGLARFRQEA